jgi:hypothetical protein
MPRLPALPSRRLPIDVAKRFAGVPSYDRPQGLRVLSEPEPGFFVLRLARRGVWVPAIIWRPCPMVIPEPLEEFADPPEYWCYPTEVSALPSQLWFIAPGTMRLVDQGPTMWAGLRARIGDDEANPFEVWEWGRTDPLVIERQLTPARAYDYRMKRREWVIAYDPASPEANPKKSVDLSKLPSLF